MKRSSKSIDLSLEDYTGWVAALDATASRQNISFKAEGLTKVCRIGDVEVRALRG